jgi:hypothetical protein
MEKSKNSKYFLNEQLDIFLQKNDLQFIIKIDFFQKKMKNFSQFLKDTIS